MWLYQDVSRKEFEERKDFAEEILCALGCEALAVELPYEQRTTTYGRDLAFQEDWISKRPIYRYKGCYYRIDEVLFSEKPFIVLEYSDTMEKVLQNMMEDIDPFPYDLSDKEMVEEIKSSLGIQQYPV